LTQPFG